MTGEHLIFHPQAMAAVFGLRHITRRPGALQQHHMPGPVQGESKSPGTKSCQQQILSPLLKAIHRLLPLHRPLTTGEQGSTQPLLQQLQRIHKSAEQHHRLAGLQQRSHEGFRRRELELGCNPAQCGQHRQRFRIGPHLTLEGSTPKVVHHQIDAMVEPKGFSV